VVFRSGFEHRHADSHLQLVRGLEHIRQQGYAIDDEETLEGVCCVARALPVVDSTKRQVAGSVTVLKAHLKGGEEQVVHRQLETIYRSLSARLGRSEELLPG